MVFDCVLVIRVYLVMDEFMETHEDGSNELLSEVILIHASH